MDTSLKVILDSKIVRDSEIPNEEFFAYIGIRALSANTLTILNKSTDKYCISIRQLAFMLTGTIRASVVKTLKDGLTGLCQRMEVDYEYVGGDFIVNVSLLWVSIGEVRFTQIYLDDIVDICGKQLSLPLLRYYCCLASTFSNPRKRGLPKLVGTTPLEELAQLANLSKKTIERSNRTLVKMGVLKITKWKFRKDKFPSNIYTLVRANYGELRKEDVNQAARENSDNLTIGDSGRRLSQIYRYLSLGHFDKYSADDVTQTYVYCLRENEKWRKRYESTGDDYCLQRIRSMTVFDNFDFLKENI